MWADLGPHNIRNTRQTRTHTHKLLLCVFHFLLWLMCEWVKEGVSGTLTVYVLLRSEAPPALPPSPHSFPGNTIYGSTGPFWWLAAFLQRQFCCWSPHHMQRQVKSSGMYLSLLTVQSPCDVMRDLCMNQIIIIIITNDEWVNLFKTLYCSRDIIHQHCFIIGEQLSIEPCFKWFIITIYKKYLWKVIITLSHAQGHFCQHTWNASRAHNVHMKGNMMYDADAAYMKWRSSFTAVGTSRRRGCRFTRARALFTFAWIKRVFKNKKRDLSLWTFALL